MYKFVVFLFFAVLIPPFASAQIREQQSLADSISWHLKKSKHTTLKNKIRITHLKSMFKLNSTLKNDSIRNRNLLTIAYDSYNLGDTLFFKKTNGEALHLSRILRDTFGIADAHWNFGTYHNNIEKRDSAYTHYQKAFQYFTQIDHEYFAAKMLYNMALIQKYVKNFTGSEILIFQALPTFKKLDKKLNLFYCYNLLGVIHSELEEYHQSIKYHILASKALNKVPVNKQHKPITYNNLGFAYQKNKNYSESIYYFNKVLKNKSLRIDDPERYARTKDNLTYSRFLQGDTLNILNDFNETLKIKDSLNYVSGIIVSNLHLAEYFISVQDTNQAITHAIEAKRLSLEIKDHRDRLNALQLLSNLDVRNAKSYLQEYINLNDSLQIQERQLRNKFTRIRFETDEHIERSEELTHQKSIILIVSIVILIILSLLYIVRLQRSKNKELLFEKEQQKSNEEIYALMLQQQSIKEESSSKERLRISEELHDGIIGKIFGTRMTFGFLNFESSQEERVKFDSLINELQDIEKEIRNLSHELNEDSLVSQQNFSTLIENLIEKHSVISGFKYQLTIDNTILWNDISGKIKINIYRIIHEALINCHKYANATQVDFSFIKDNDSFNLTIEDNGIGFDVLKKRKGIGLKNIESRALNIHGKYQINSIIKKGTIIKIAIPI